MSTVHQIAWSSRKHGDLMLWNNLCMSAHIRYMFRSMQSFLLNIKIAQLKIQLDALNNNLSHLIEVDVTFYMYVIHNFIIHFIISGITGKADITRFHNIDCYI